MILITFVSFILKLAGLYLNIKDVCMFLVRSICVNEIEERKIDSMSNIVKKKKNV